MNWSSDRVQHISERDSPEYSVERAERGLVREHVVVVLYERLRHHVVELEVEDGRDRLARGSQQRRPEAHRQVADRHQVLVTLARHAVPPHNITLQSAHVRRSRQRGGYTHVYTYLRRCLSTSCSMARCGGGSARATLATPRARSAPSSHSVDEHTAHCQSPRLEDTCATVT